MANLTVHIIMPGSGSRGTLGPSVHELAEMGEETWERVIDINLKGVWLCMKYEIIQMLTQGGGTIVESDLRFGWGWSVSPGVAPARIMQASMGW